MLLNRLIHSILLSLFILGSSGLQGQGTTDDQLAAHYYREGDYEKALLYYQKLYDARPSEDNYRYYLKCLLALEEYKPAEKLAKNQAKYNARTLRYQVDVGNVLRLAGEPSKSSKHFDKIIKELDRASVTQILDMGKAFSEISLEHRALEVYNRGRKQIGDSYPFHFQIASVLGQMGDVEGMINEYLDVLEVSPSYLQNVQNTLNRVIGFEETNAYNEVLQDQLLKRVQKNPSSDIYSEMLTWMYIKQNRFAAAMTQVKAIDKRNKEDGIRVMKLSLLALNNYKYQVAVDGYKYVREKGPSNFHHVLASVGMLCAMKEDVISSEYTLAAIEDLLDEYLSVLVDLGQNKGSWEIIRDYAHLKAFYQGKYDQSAVKESIDVLSNAVQLPGLSEIELAQLKLELADVYVISNKIWDASLLYGQVEKKFKYEEIGFEAKLKNAKVFYYSGDFEWSEAQLDALKGSTSKLIANDALELSAFISENTGLDTTMDALALFAKSDLMIVQHKYDSALLFLELIESNYPGHELMDNILFQLARINQAQSQPERAAETYLELAETYPFGILVDNALMEAARIYENKLNQPEKAMELYEQILTEFTNSLFVIEARKRFRHLRGDLLQ